MIRPTAIAALLTAACSSAPGLAQISVGPIAHPTTGTRYYRTTSSNWNTANARAAALSGTLVTIHDAATNEWVRANLASAGGNSQDCFIGINDVASEGTFFWSNSEKPTYLNWRAGEPNNAGGAEDFGIMSPSTGQWNDIPTGFNRPAIVEVTGPIRVPLEYPTIQAAVDAAVDGQSILVAPGQYTGAVDYGTKKLSIRSESGPGDTTLRIPAVGVGITMAGGQGSETTLEGFTIVPDAGGIAYMVVAVNGQIVRNCRITNPDAYGVALRGTAVLSDSLIVNTVIAVASASGGNITRATIQNCTLVGNTQAVSCSNEGVNLPVTITLINSATAGNVNPFVAGPGTNIFFYSNVVAEMPLGPTNLNADPRFIGAPGDDGIYGINDDYRLASNSPCIDAGNNARRKPLTTLSVLTDLAGQARFFDVPTVTDTGAGPGPMSDCGAYEYTAGPLCPADFNADSFLDFFDYDAFVEAFENGCAS